MASYIAKMLDVPVCLFDFFLHFFKSNTFFSELSVASTTRVLNLDQIKFIFVLNKKKKKSH